MVGSLTADGDVLGFKEGHLAAHLVGRTCLGDAGVDAQHLWICFELLPQGGLVVAPAGGRGRGVRTDAAGWRRTRISVNGQPPGVWPTTLQWRWQDSLEHAVAAVPLNGGGRDPLGHTRHQVLLPWEVVVCQVFNLSENYRHRG